MHGLLRKNLRPIFFQELTTMAEKMPVLSSKCDTGKQEANKYREIVDQEAKEKVDMEIKRVEDAEKKINEANQLLRELKTARSDRKEKLDKRVQKLEQLICEKFHITPKPWVSSEKSLETLISLLETQLEKYSLLRTRNKLDDATLLQKVSGGRALQGVFLTKNLQDQQKRRACLLKVPENVSVTGASYLEEDIADFSSKHQEDSYSTRPTGDILCHSVAVSAQAPAYGFLSGAEASESIGNKKETTAKENEQIMYSSTIKYCSMHVASYTFGLSDLKLSDDAKEDLKVITETVKTASKSKVQRACKKFLRTYGSHVNQGPLQFGGSFRWTCSSHGIDTEEMETVKKLQREAVTTEAGVLFDSIKSEYAGKCSESTLASTQLMFNVNGGPTEFSDLSVWKAGLVANNSTWILTDRGSKLVAVWDVIGMNHQNELGVVREVLRKAWEQMTGLQSGPDFMPNPKYDPEEVLREVSKWNGKELTPRELEDNLLFLFKVKEDLRRNVAHPRYWVEKYLSHKALQEFLSVVVDSQESTMGSKFLVQRTFQERELEKLPTCICPDIERISEWLYKKSDQPSSPKVDCPDFESFIGYLKKTIDDITRAQLVPASGQLLGPANSLYCYNIPVATNVSRAICSLQSNYQGKYDDILIKILTFPFQNDDVISLNPLSLPDLKSLLEKFIKGRSKYTAAIGAGDSALKKQSMLFLLALSSYNMLQESLFKLHLKKVGQMMEVLEPPLETVLSHELMSYLRGSYPLTQFKNNLDSLLATGHLPKFDQTQSSRRESASLHHLLSTLVAEQSTSKPEQNVIPKTESNPEAHTLFSKLGLTEHYYKKLGLQDALCIRSKPLEMSLKISNPTEPKQLPFLALQKLMSFDSQCRSDLMKESRPKGISGNSTKIHPADVLLALIICSDHFLRQDLFARLAKCQYAVPFILPDPFAKELLLPLWAMRSITKEWRSVQTVQGEMKVVEHTSSIVKYPMPIISFLRLGKRQKRGASKSRILNRVISESEHFFHRHLPGGSFKQVLGDGLVDMSWYLPCARAADIFPDAITFLNLHGDACSHPLQSRFLSKISSMCFILLTEEELDFNEHIFKTLKHFSSSTGGITLLKDIEEVPEIFTNGSLPATSIKLEDLNGAEITDEIQEQIRDKLFAKKQLKTNLTIEECCMALEKGIHVDEDAKVFKKGQEHANEVASLVRDGDSIKLNAKEEMLPLQGDDLWRAWSAWNKELHRGKNIGEKTVNSYVSEIEVKKAVIHSRQCEFVEVLTPVMERFIRSLLTVEKTARNVFLQHLILDLNSLSGERISGLLAQYQATREEISKLQHTTESKARKENASKFEAYRGELEVLQSAIVRASFGLHHLLRELGQVYEVACYSVYDRDHQLSTLPKVATEILLDGYPLELMDGDAAHVPVKWVQAVINELNKKLGDPRTFVLSVLGLKSSEKSTMLNAVFGLTYSTSAGRCTRGAFMQLLPVDETIKAATDYSYVLVIDTKGLCMPELDSSQACKHDYELATFIIGLADLTFISEVAGDLEDILLTTVHAFLRMIRVKYNPSCQFIHQNSGSSTKDQIGRDSFVKHLDKWTIDAAREESCVGRYEKFSDVIQFDDQEDVHHFPGLWKGDPPMAPVNQGYSHAAQRLKFNMLQKLQQAKGINISAFRIKIGDLWNELLRENFSFKNNGVGRCED